MRNMVVPYISMRSPRRWAPTLMASEHASTVPAITGVPAFSPVAAAAVVVTEPTTSPGQTSGGRCSLCAMCETHGSYHD
jgi:hypothetical protein